MLNCDSQQQGSYLPYTDRKVSYYSGLSYIGSTPGFGPGR